MLFIKCTRRMARKTPPEQKHQKGTLECCVCEQKGSGDEYTETSHQENQTWSSYCLLAHTVCAGYVTREVFTHGF